MPRARRLGGPTRSRMMRWSIAEGARASAVWAKAEARPTAHSRLASRVRVESAIVGRLTSRRRRDRALVRATAWCASEQGSGTRTSSDAADWRRWRRSSCIDANCVVERLRALSGPSDTRQTRRRVDPTEVYRCDAAVQLARPLLLVCEPLQHLHTPCPHWPARRLAPTRSLHTCTRRLARCTGLTLSDGPQSLRRGRSARLRCVGAWLESL